ncbi:MAG: MBL fold metallo-hydrolase [Spirochaetaceae bacterium]|nr:MBL fold metallo-hydrolase [Spirochaetaceae bacterium]
MAPGLFYISGNDWVGAYLIDTGDGVVLIDTAMHETVYLLLENLRRLGFAPTDIKKILVSHAHIDHIGGARALKELTGAKVYLGERDLLFLGRPDLIGDEGKHTCGSVEPDELYEDDKPIRQGAIEIRTVSTPGHTPGCTSFFFEVVEKGGRRLRCGMHGGVGLNTMTNEYFKTSGLPISLRDEFIANLEKLDRIDVDVCLPSHTNQVEILAQRERITEDFNPYINPSVWHEFLRERLRKVRALVEQEAKGPGKNLS